MLDYLRSHRHGRAIAVTEQQAAEFWHAIEALDLTQRRVISSYEAAQPKTPEEQALEVDEEHVAAGLERRFAAVEVRPDQGAFRRSLMKAYGGRCALSGNNVGAVLQAAHVIPFSEEIDLRNDVRNGLLLRADLHILYDKFLITIHPVTGKVVVAESLRGTSYEQFEGRTARHQVNPEFLRRVYEEFCRRSPKMEAVL
ncbi:MAG: HNH endonuclease signature motif containing protein [Pseudorhizobium pelagicum]|uniref:HNH endonuclease n=1 Tax=Pseudorhizobium pelagicum TaxID=1509405 RepID=UPI0034605909